MKLSIVLLAALVAGCSSLPHRTTGLDPQGHLESGKNPNGDLCPSQHLMTVQTDDGTEFSLECWGKK